MKHQMDTKPQEYEKAVHLLTELLELDTGTEERINKYIRNYGICNFFDNLGAFGFPLKTLEKLQALKSILDTIISGKNKTGLNTDGGEK
jgi:hypothetical protein